MLEDAPAPSAIHSFKAEVKDGKVLVTADPSATLSANKARQPTLLATGADAAGQGKGVVIAGGGSGAFMCIESLREVRIPDPLALKLEIGANAHWGQHGYKGPITVVSKEPHSPIDRSASSLSQCYYWIGH